MPKTSLLNPNRDEAGKELIHIYERLHNEHQLNVFEVGNSNGIVHIRAHNFDKYGDDKSDIPAIQGALKGQSYSGFEFGNSGLGVRAFSPIEYNGQIIGTLQIRLKDSFLQEIIGMLPGANINLYDLEGVIVQSSEQSRVGIKIEEQGVLEKIQTGEIIRKNNEDFTISYIPMYDPTESKVIGTIQLMQDASIINDFMNRYTLISSIILIAVLLLIIIGTILLGHSISKPIAAVSEMMHRLKDGDLTIRIEKQKRADEIGKLYKDMRELQEQLHHTIKQVANASTVVLNESELLSRSTEEVSSGSEEIAKTMEELAKGSERQSNAVSEVSVIMAMYASNMSETSKKGTELQHTSERVLELSNNGYELIEKSNEQFKCIFEVMQQSVQKMQMLDRETKEIYRFVDIIKDISNETNLLALNASIEAARAGEHGKGFAVVAEKVRQLAVEVGSSVTEITTLVQNIQHESTSVSQSLQSGYKQIEQGSEHMNTTTETFRNIQLSVFNMIEFIHTIIRNIEQMAEEGQDINASLQEILAISEESTVGIEETTATVRSSSKLMNEIANGTKQLSQLANDLNSIVNQYKI
ncbi:methyl-accepting chemotaxis protein [Ureibacillus sp. FSL W8-0352]|uniref:methyl-accepting chemotaxis protein n=1 Tax=Ureibacillus sp. FSL W8-0352 TaxID=2954596 RepID=UPI0030FC25B9